MVENEKIALLSDLETESLVNFIFQNLPDDVVDQIDLTRLSPEAGGVAREPVTTAAILTFGSVLSVQIFRLIEKWMEQKRQQQAVTLIYEASKNGDSEAVKVLADLEKRHTDLSIKFGIVSLKDLRKSG
jgi:hypothetical protein